MQTNEQGKETQLRESQTAGPAPQGTPDFQATWERYVSAWKVDTEAEQRALFERCLAPGCVYVDPLTQATGWGALVSYMQSFHQQIPGGHFVTKRFMAHHGRSMAQWNLVDGKGTVVGDGISYGEYDDAGKLVAMTGFFETP